MRSYLFDFNEISLIQKGRDQARALDDLNHERSGLEVGRMARFLGDDAGGEAAARKRGGRADNPLSALQLALLDPDYAALHANAMTNLRNWEDATERAITKAEAHLDEAETGMDDVLENAATLPDGTRVFRDAETGEVMTEHGDELDPSVAATIVWRGDEPSYQDFIISQQALDQARADLAELRNYEVQLGDYRARLTDEDDPPSADDIKAMTERAANAMPELVRREIEEPGVVAAPISTVNATALPTLGD